MSGGLADPDMPRLVAAAGVSYVVVHWRGHSQDMYARAVYADVVTEVRDELAKRVDAVVHAGVDPGRIVLDPGLGFGKRPEHNWPLLARLAELGTLAGGTFPVLVGASRKGFLGKLLAGPTARHGRSPTGIRPRWRSPRWPPRPAPGACACTWSRRTRTRSWSRPPGGGADDRSEPRQRTSVVLSVGSNLGDRLGTLQGCVHAISGLPETDVLAVSPVYETAPVGGPAQPDYLNAVLIVATGLTRGTCSRRPSASRRTSAGYGPKGRTLRSAYPRHRHHQLRRRRSAMTRCSPCRTRARTSGPSSSRRGTTSTRRPACPAAGPSPPCSPPSARMASGASPA